MYLQSQNGNICREQYPGQDTEEAPELSAFGEILEDDVKWMSEALGEQELVEVAYTDARVRRRQARGRQPLDRR